MPEDPNPDRLLAEARALTEQSGFDAALTSFCLHVPAIYRRTGLVARAVVETRRWAVAMMIAAQAVSGGAGVTRADLAKAFGGDLTGRRGIAGIVSVLMSAGLVEEVREGRVKLLMPTPFLLDLLRRSFEARWEALRCVMRGKRYDLEGRLDELFGHFLTAQIESYVRSRFKLHDLLPEVKPFTEHVAGFFILLDLLARRAEPDSELEVELTGMAADWSVSRTHVQKILKGAAAHGLVELVRRGRISLRAEARTTLQLWIAIELVWLDRLMRSRL